METTSATPPLSEDNDKVLVGIIIALSTLMLLGVVTGIGVLFWLTRRSRRGHGPPPIELDDLGGAFNIPDDPSFNNDTNYESIVTTGSDL
ncbi:MAG: hypothetical protein V3T76_01065 [candidate division NC10 bacterium]